jgi:thiol-disulfide isomerase/thioredoxin
MNRILYRILQPYHAEHRSRYVWQFLGIRAGSVGVVLALWGTPNSSIAQADSAGRASSTVLAMTSAEKLPPLPSRTITPNEVNGLLFIGQTGHYTVQERAERRAMEWARQFTAALDTDPAHASETQIFSLAMLYLALGHDSVTKRIVDTRLATSGLSLRQRAGTLKFAAHAFVRTTPAGDVDLSAARPYLDRLEAMSDSVNFTKADAHLDLVSAYFQTGQGAQVVAEWHRAMRWAATLPFWKRTNFGVDGYEMVADVLLGDPHQRPVIDSLGTFLLSLAHASPAELAMDEGKPQPQMHLIEQDTRDYIQRRIEGLRGIGVPAPPVVATHWFNTTPPSQMRPDDAPLARGLPFGDGKIRVVELGAWWCDGCKLAAPLLQQLRSEFVDSAAHGQQPWQRTPVEFVYMSDAPQRWGGKDCTPDESAEHMRKLYVDFMQLTTLPIGVWAGPVDDTVSDPGNRVARGEPNAGRYIMDGYPLFIVVDGHGVLRFRQYGLDMVAMRRVVTYLQKEAHRQATPATLRATTSSTPAPIPASVRPVVVYEPVRRGES